MITYSYPTADVKITNYFSDVVLHLDTFFKNVYSIRSGKGTVQKSDSPFIQIIVVL